jgi:hypothetical protein
MNTPGVVWLFGALPESHHTGGSVVSDRVWGVAAFAGVYVLLFLWLCFMPSRLLDEPAGRPWWKSSRLWAIVIATVQILVYLGLG